MMVFLYITRIFPHGVPPEWDPNAILSGNWRVRYVNSGSPLASPAIAPNTGGSSMVEWPSTPMYRMHATQVFMDQHKPKSSRPMSNFLTIGYCAPANWWIRTSHNCSILIGGFRNQSSDPTCKSSPLITTTGQHSGNAAS